MKNRIPGQILFLILIFFGGNQSQAQQITEEPAITTMMENYINYNQANKHMRGWRIQILVTTDRRQMENARSRFEYKYPDYPIKFSHSNPFYHLQTGAFITRQEARPLLKIIQRDFQSAFLVTDDFEVTELMEY
jgi:hypothetical protein